jgi:hypothetical protein
MTSGSGGGRDGTSGPTEADRAPQFVRMGCLIAVTVLAASQFACTSSQSQADGGPPPPSQEAAPWVGCYTCSSSLRTPPLSGVDAEAPVIQFNTGVYVAAAGSTLTADIFSVTPDASFTECWWTASVITKATASLAPDLDGGAGCPLLLFDSNVLPLSIYYTSGTFLRDGGALSADLTARVLQSNATGTEFVDAGTGMQVSICERASEATCNGGN